MPTWEFGEAVLKKRIISINDIPKQPTKEELMEKKKQDIIKKHGKPIRKIYDKEEMIRKWGKRKWV